CTPSVKRTPRGSSPWPLPRRAARSISSARAAARARSTTLSTLGASSRSSIESLTMPIRVRARSFTAPKAYMPLGSSFKVKGKSSRGCFSLPIHRYVTVEPSFTRSYWDVCSHGDCPVEGAYEQVYFGFPDFSLKLQHRAQSGAVRLRQIDDLFHRETARQHEGK